MSTELPLVLLTAPIGKAAVNIGGTTLHAAFHLPVKQRGAQFQYRRPSSVLLNSMRSKYAELKILIIDEISMVGAQTFSNLNLTLQEIFEVNQPFGGISVFAVGDLMQLNPVGEKPVYKQITTGYSSLLTTVWTLFSLYQLIDIVRQKDDPYFAELLSRIRLGIHTPADMKAIKQLENNENIPDDCISLFLTNALKDIYNCKQLSALSSTVHTMKAKDSRTDSQTRRLHVSVTVTSTNPHETGGLCHEIQVAEKARYMHTKNTDIVDGLVNGATGTVDKLDINTSNPLKSTIYVKFDDSNIGRQAKLKTKYKGLVPIHPASATFTVTDKSASILVERTQFPGNLAWGITVHKSQGSTFSEMIADMTTQGNRTTTMPGQIYTMLSRVKSTQGLKVCNFLESKIKVNSSALEEMDRLAKTSNLLCNGVLPPKMSANCIIVSNLNIRSLKQHHQDLIIDDNITSSDILCLTETKVTKTNNYSNYEIKDFTLFSGKTNHGCAIYTRFSDAVQCSLDSLHLENIETVSILVQRTLVICVYIPPKTLISEL